MDGWIQHADFASVDLTFADADEAVAIWTDFDKLTADALMQRLEAAGDEFCQWGISFTNDDGVRIHVYRESIADDTYSVLISKGYAENQMAAMPSGFVEGVIRTFFEDWRPLLPAVG